MNSKRPEERSPKPAFQRLEKESGTEAQAMRTICKDHWTACTDASETSPLDRRRHLTIAAVLAQRRRLEELRDADQIGATQYLELQEDLDWKQLSVGSDEERRITES
ncbi:hypothetical protein ACVITL_003639 [Rhizobium pisi]